VEVGIRTIFTAPTPGGIARAVSGEAAEAGLLLPLRTGGEQPPLFCFPPSSGLSSCYRGLAAALPADRPVYGLQARGYVAGEELPDSVERMAADYLAELRGVQPEGPYHLAGWSFGALVAHAVATRLQQEGAEVALLVSIDGYPHDPAAADEEERRRPGGGAMADVERVNAHHIGLMKQFTPGVFRGDLVVFVAGQGRPASDRAAASPDSWSPFVDGRVRDITVDADHFSMLSANSAPEIAQIVSGFLYGQDISVSH
jgi:thioesterase domain-containing protein